MIASATPGNRNGRALSRPHIRRPATRVAGRTTKPESASDALVIVANRLPITITSDGAVERSPGGLASALSSVVTEGSHWIGWTGQVGAPTSPLPDDGLTLHAVPLTAAEVDGYYDGFANSVLWPLFHNRLQQPELRRSWWRTYRHVNQHFADMVVEVAPPGALVWVHDYHLLLVPAMVRARRRDLRVGLFSHIPFPGPRLFGTLPWRRELLLGMADAHVIGFQTEDDVHNFQDAMHRFVGPLRRGRRGASVVDAFPISVDVAKWAALGDDASAGATALAEPGVVVYLGIDRLDYTKGIVQRLQAFGELLNDGQLDPAKCRFVQVAVPTRTDVPAYQEEKEAVEGLAERINQRHATPGSPGPVQYLDTPLDGPELAAWYRRADALVVTSLADGMNLVAKEFVSARTDLDGAVVLSEFAGAAHDMPGAIIVNPYDIEAIKRAMVAVFRMSPMERHERMSTMRDAVEANDVHHWARRFVERLRAAPVARPFRFPGRAGGRVAS